MGKAGRKVQTIELPERPLHLPSTHPRNFSVTTRNLCKSDLGGVIFGCKHETKDECLRKQLFGLTSFHYPYIKNVKQGLPLFLFNYSDRKLYGIYEAASHGQMNIDSRAWTEDDTETTKFPAQVRFHVKTQCVPLVEKQYFETLKDNYYTDKYFWFELDHTQTKALIALFKPLPVPNLSSMKDIVPSSRSNQLKATTNGEPTGAVKWKQNFKPSVAVVNKNKFASLTWDDSCSSNICNSASDEGEIKESDSNQESYLTGENVQESHLDVIPREGANQSSHGSWWETSTGAIEVGQHNEDVSEWGPEYPWKSTQHNSGASVHLNGENHDFVGTDAINESEFKGTGFGADWFTYERAFEELPSRSDKLKPLNNAKWTKVGTGKRKKKSKALTGSQNAIKLASSTWEVGCSRKIHNGAPQERGIRNHLSDRGSGWAGKNVQKGHSGDSPYVRAANQWHNSWSKTDSGDSEEKKHVGDASEWEAEYPWQDMQYNSGVSAHLSEKCHDFGGTDPVVERDFKDTVSDWEADWSSDVEADWSKEIAHDVPSYVCSHLGEENESCLKQQSGAKASEIPLRNLQIEKGPSPKIFNDGGDTGPIQEKIRLPKEPDIVDKKRKTTQDLARDSHEESGLHHKSANIVELEQNTSSPYLYDENAEWGQIIKVLKETTEALENKQVEADLELQELRNAIKESEKTIDELKAHVKELELTHSIVGTTSSTCAKHCIGSEKVIYLIGGYDDSTCLSSMVSFSPSVDLVKPLKSMSSGRACASAAALNDNLYVFGGRGCSSSFDTVLCYSTKNDEWTSSPNLFCPKLGLAGASLDGKIYALGGCYGSTYFSEVEMLDPALGRWISLQPMLQKRFALAAAELHGVLYAVGGFDGRCYLQSVERYDPRVGRWMSLTGMKTSRGWHALAAFNDKLYAIGGHDGVKMLSSVETFDPRVGTWMAGEPLSVARGYSAAVVLDDSILVIGGKQDGDLDVDAAECYKEGTGWSASNFKSIGKMSYVSAVVI